MQSRWSNILTIKCEGCGDRFEHFVRIKNFKKVKRLCDTCLMVRDRARKRARSKIRRELLHGHVGAG